MAIAEITQYHLPHGRKSLTHAEIPDTLAEKYESIYRSGCNLGAEVLNTGQVSLTIEDPISEQDYKIQVVPNGPEVSIALIKLIESFDNDELANFRRIMADSDYDE